MDEDATLNLLRQRLVKTFAELGATGPVVRTVLLHDRYFVGHRFRCEGLQAVRLAGMDEIALYDESGTLLKTVTLEASAASQ